ncbi:MAG TPA: phage tail protein, partial [Burkholderiaceae bacterium]|nr:phage tail protein [Burkholderiaceae bacterium]
GSTARLVLRRGFTGSLELYRWCEDARAGREGHVRTVDVDLLDGETGRVVCSWKFTRARPEQLSYSPLTALDSSVLVETLSLSFAGMTIN